MVGAKIRDFIRRFTHDGIERSKHRLSVDVSSNGTSTVVSSKELEDVLFRRFEEMHRAARPLTANSEPD